jgi:hypothetical protein
MSLYCKEDLFNINELNGSPVTVHFHAKSVSSRDNKGSKTVLKLLLSDAEKEAMRHNITTNTRSFGLVKCLARPVEEKGPAREIQFHTNDVHKIVLAS